MSSFINRDPGMHIVYEIDLPEDPRRDFTAEEQALLRPIAETLAMLDGNAFFSMPLEDGKEWYEQYLPEAWELWHSNGGLTSAVRALWDQYQTLLRLTKP